jgi:hypothetical protein
VTPASPGFWAATCMLLHPDRAQPAVLPANFEFCLDTAFRAPPVQAKIRMVEACLAANRFQDARSYLEKAVKEDTSFAATMIFRDLEKKVLAVVQT